MWLSFTQTLAAFMAGCEAAWAFFGGVLKVLVSAIVYDGVRAPPALTRAAKTM